MLHYIFQRYRIPPDDIYNKTDGAKNFIYASVITQIEEENREEKRRQAREGR